MSAIVTPVTSFVKGIFGLGNGKQKLNKIKPMDISAQTSEEGNPQPVVWGISRPIGGNVIYQSRPIRVIKKERVEGGGGGGKGGSSKKKKQYQNVEYVYRYYAIRVCRGDGILYRRIWRNNKLVYDARRGSEWGAKNNHLFLQKARLYSGSWEQMPDSILETQLGVGNVPAFRGLAYMVINYEDVTDLGGAIPQYTFEVCRPNGFILTSRPYALEDEPSSGAFAVSVKESPSTNIVEQSGSTGVAILGGQSSGTWKQAPEPEEMNATGWVNEITMTRTTRYGSMDAGVERMNATGWVSGIIMTRTTRYSDYTVEPQEMNATGWVNEIIMTRTSGEAGGSPTMTDMYGEDFPVTYYARVWNDYWGWQDILTDSTYHERIEDSLDRARELHPNDLNDPYFYSITFFVTPSEITITTSVRPNGNGDAGFICYYPNDGTAIEDIVLPQVPPRMKRLPYDGWSSQITYERIVE